MTSDQLDLKLRLRHTEIDSIRSQTQNSVTYRTGTICGKITVSTTA